MENQNMERKIGFLALAFAAALACAARADQPKNQGTQASPDNLTLFRTSDLIGMKVWNSKGEDLGKIDDLVVDGPTGKIRYAALSHGGFLGMGDKLFAVPWDQFKLSRDVAKNRTDLVLNVSLATLEKAPGFNKDNWPTMGVNDWQHIDQYYRTAQQHGTTTR
jgi:sporulation protein YlmC with PRC-barrel domain